MKTFKTNTKTFAIKIISLLIFVACIPFLGWGQTTTINFDNAGSWTAGSGLITSYQSDHTYIASNWTFTGGPALRQTTAAQDGFAGALGTYSWRLQDAAGVVWTGTYNTAGTISAFGFKFRRWDASPALDHTVSYSINGGSSWTSAGNLTASTSDWQTFSHTLASAATVTAGQFIVRIVRNGGERVMVDDFNFTLSASCTAPTTQASNIAASFTCSNVLIVNWTNGNGTKRVVKMNTSNSFTAPANGTDPTANTTYAGSGEQVIYNNTGNSVTVSGLNASTTYWFRVYEYNCTGTNTVYNTATATNNPRSLATNTATCASTGDYRTKAIGNWGDLGTWETYNGSTWVAASVIPDASTASVFIQHSIILNVGPQSVNNLYIEPGGKLYRNSSSVSNLNYLTIKGDIVCNGTIGNGSTLDAIGFNIMSGTHTISGSGNFDCYRIRKDASDAGNTTLIIDMDMNLRWTQTIGGGGSGTNAMHNNRSAAASIYDVTINAGKTLRLINTSYDASLGIDGAGYLNNDTVYTNANRGGGYTVFGTVIIDGFIWLGSRTTAGSPHTPYLRIKNGGVVQTRYINIGNDNQRGELTIENGGKLVITDVGSGSDTWLNTSAGSISYNIASGSTIEYSRNGNQNVQGNLFNYKNLTISGGGIKSITSNTTVDGTLTFSNGMIHTGTHRLIVSNTNTSAIADYSSSKYINGNLRRYVSATGSYPLPVGTSSNYQLANLNLNASAGLSYVDVHFNEIGSTPLNISSLNLEVSGTPLQTLLNGGYWTITPNAVTSANYDITLNLKGSTNAGSNAAQHSIVKRANSASNWEVQGNHNNAHQSISGGIVAAKRTGLTAFSDYAIAKHDDNTLPVELIGFNAVRNANKVYLKWITASEFNNDYFIIEKSMDAFNFIPIHKEYGAGFSNTTNQYSFVDEAETDNTLYYRLKQVDFDGSTTHSDIVEVAENINNPLFVSNIYHQNGYLQIRIIAGDVLPINISIIDLNGRTIYADVKNSAVAQALELNIPSNYFSKGIYFLRVFSEHAISHTKFSVN